MGKSEVFPSSPKSNPPRVEAGTGGYTTSEEPTCGREKNSTVWGGALGEKELLDRRSRPVPSRQGLFVTTNHNSEDVGLNGG